MQSKIVSSIIASSSKLAVIIDEASSLSHKAVMTVSIKATVQEEESIEFIFLELVELENQRADGIVEGYSLFNKCCFTEEWLLENWVAFVTDGCQCHVRKKVRSSNQVDLEIPDAFCMALYEP